MNSLFNQLQPNTPPLNNNLAQIVKSSSDPGMLFKTMAQNSPQVQSIMQMIQAANMTPKDYFYKTAQERGVDPNQVLGMFR